MHLHEIQRAAWETARSKGLHDNLNSLPFREQTLIRLALIHTEVSEATQEVKRHGVTPQNRARIAEELADTIIRIADLAQCLQIDLDLAVPRILEANTHRPLYYGTPAEITPDARHGQRPGPVQHALRQMAQGMLTDIVNEVPVNPLVETSGCDMSPESRKTEEGKNHALEVSNGHIDAVAGAIGDGPGMDPALAPFVECSQRSCSHVSGMHDSDPTSPTFTRCLVCGVHCPGFQPRVP